MEKTEVLTTKRDKLFIVLLIITALVVISANIAVNFF